MRNKKSLVISSLGYYPNKKSFSVNQYLSKIPILREIFISHIVKNILNFLLFPN